MELTYYRVEADLCARYRAQKRARQNQAGRARSITLCARRLVLLALLMSCLPLQPSSGAAPEVRGINLRQALENTLGRNKQLAAFEYRLAEQDGRLEQAGLRPNPKLDLMFENVAGQGAFSGFDNAETTLSLSWAIEPGLRKHRVGVALAQSAGIDREAQILQLDVVAETAQRFLSCLESQAHLQATEEAVSLAEQNVDMVERYVGAGRSPKAELMRARAELAAKRLGHDDITHERSVAYHRLAAQWGDTTPTFTRVEGELTTLPTIAAFHELVARIELNPELARLASQQRIAEAQLHLAQARRWPNVTPSVGARKFETTSDWALVAGLTVPLGVFDRNQGRIAESRASVARSRADIEAESIRIHTQLFEIYQQMQHSIHRAEVLRDEVIPRFEEATAESRHGYERGRYPYSELRIVQSDLLEARRSLVEAITSAHRLVITLERLTGERVAK